MAGEPAGRQSVEKNLVNAAAVLNMCIADLNPPAPDAAFPSESIGGVCRRFLGHV